MRRRRTCQCCYSGPFRPSLLLVASAIIWFALFTKRDCWRREEARPVFRLGLFLAYSVSQIRTLLTTNQDMRGKYGQHPERPASKCLSLNFREDWEAAFHTLWRV